MRKNYLAIDIGASSGRHIVGYYEDGKLIEDEVYRFPNGAVKEGESLVWDLDALTEGVIEGIAKAFASYGAIESVAIDTWGVDYVLLDGDKEILPCYAYRDGRTEKSIPLVHEIISVEELYATTGVQSQPYNTIYQLYADKIAGRLEKATDFLMMPQYLSYRLTGVKKHEYTEETTGGLVKANERSYCSEIIEKLGFPSRLFGEISTPGTVVGQLKPEIAKRVGGNATVVLCASHDTASAVEGIPMDKEGLFLSSGTWSLLGAKVERAGTDELSRIHGFSNEGGVGYTRYLKNITGMWLVQSLKKEICPSASFDEIVKWARSSTFERTVEVNDDAFYAPQSMKKAFDDYFLDGEKPQNAGDYFRCAYKSIARCYGETVRAIEKTHGKKYERVYIVGGGAKNEYLNELTASETGLKVIALPIEATALGNLKIQAERNKNQNN